MRTPRPDDLDATGPIPVPAAYVRDAGRRRITGATAWSAAGGTALAVTFGALFAQATANADAEKAPAKPVAVANTQKAPKTTTAPQPTATAAKPTAPRSAAPKVVVNPTDEPDAPAHPAEAPEAATPDGPAHAATGAT